MTELIGKKNREKDILLHELGRRDGKKSHELQYFSFESIAAATNNFTSTSKLGEGGFGSVYKVYFMTFDKMMEKSNISC